MALLTSYDKCVLLANLALKRKFLLYRPWRIKLQYLISFVPTTFNLAEKKQSSGFNDVTNKKWYYMWELRLNVSYPNSTREWRQTVILDSDLTLSKHYGFGWLFDNKRNNAEIDVNLMGFWFEGISFGNN